MPYPRKPKGIPISAMRCLGVLSIILMMQACKHPLGISGEGDIVDTNGSGAGCTLEQFNVNDPACTENEVTGGYTPNYQGIPRPGWEFTGWDGPCSSPQSVGEFCAFDVPAFIVVQFPTYTMPTTIAVFDSINEWSDGYWDIMMWQ